jgi:hypothetical protein
MISFLTAFSLECIIKSSEIYAILPVLVAWIMIGALVLWCVTTGWERENPFTWANVFLCGLKYKLQAWKKGSAGTNVSENPNNASWSNFWQAPPRGMSTGEGSSTVVGSPELSPDPESQTGV